jgi:glycosyltransferase involved in cell wall biosynthesis
MACGTPVIAHARGSMPEIIEPGVTGQLVGGIGEAVDAVARIGGLDRSAIRAVAVERFGVDRMVDEYVTLYGHVLDGG